MKRVYSTLTHSYIEVPDTEIASTIYYNTTPVPTIDLMVPNDGQIRTYRVREHRGSSSCTVTATSRDEAKEKAHNEHGLEGKLVVDVL